MIQGIDVSHHNGAVDWQAVAKGGVRFAFAKASQGTTYRDARFAENWKGMKDAGLIRGAYHFVGSGDARAQVDHFVECAGEFELPPVLDIEAEDLSRAMVGEAIEYAKQRCAVNPIIYTGNFWVERLGDPGEDEMPFGDCPLWFAQYAKKPTRIPRLWKRWTFWQYSSKGQVPGVEGAVDLDWFNGTLDELRALTLDRTGSDDGHRDPSESSQTSPEKPLEVR